jgi:formate hydrogenlyase subunit 3/multisubunit Na+/H+ antiporter MnhD subunit
MDGLSAFFILVMVIGAATNAVYSGGRMRDYFGRGISAGRYFMWFNFLTVSMLLVTVMERAVPFLIAWEAMTVSSYFLITFDPRDTAGRRFALSYLISMQVGAALLFAAFMLAMTSSLSSSSSSTSAISSISGAVAAGISVAGGGFADFKNVLSTRGGISNALFALFFCGFAFKAGFVPFHTWVPGAYAAAPGGGAAVMSGMMKKAAFYGILRTISLMGRPSAWMGYAVLAVACVTALYGVINAMAQRDLKRMLAFSGVENAGIIGIGIGTGLLGAASGIPAMTFLGYAGALFHILSHSIFKSLMFNAAGCVAGATAGIVDGASCGLDGAIGRRSESEGVDIESMGGLLKRMPVTGWSFLVGALSACAVPPFCGFIGEFLIYLGLLGAPAGGGVLSSVRVVAAAALALTGGLALAAFSGVFGTVFLGAPRSRAAAIAPGDLHGQTTPNAPRLSMTLSVTFSALLCAVVGLWPEPVLKILAQPTDVLGAYNALYFRQSVAVVAVVARAGLFFINIAVVLHVLRRLLLKGKTVSSVPTWGCGYGAASARMQYSASSFSDTLLKLFGRLAGLRTTAGQSDAIDKGSGALFPAEKPGFAVTRMDIVEGAVVLPLQRILKALFERFSWVQSGRIEHYILYILVTLVVMLVFSIRGGIK